MRQGKTLDAFIENKESRCNIIVELNYNYVFCLGVMIQLFFFFFFFLNMIIRGRQRKRWEDNIKEWTGLEWNIIPRKAENREEWRKLAEKSTVVPQRSARLRDR